MKKRNNLNSLAIEEIFDFCDIVCALIKDSSIKKEIVNEILALRNEITNAVRLKNITDQKEGNWMYRLSMCKEKLVPQVVGISYDEFMVNKNSFLPR